MGSSKKRSERFLCQFASTLKELFPKWDEWLNRIPDPRQEAKCTYSLHTLLWLSLLLMLSGQESRNQYNENLFNEEAQTILEKMFGVELPAIAHGDTLAHLWKHLDAVAIEKLKTSMVRTLLRRRCLEKFRYRHRYYILAVDGTELYRWSEPHCPNCLYAASGPNKELQYYHRVLEIKLVSTSGLCLSLLSEFIENGGEDIKQDCELKAFYRLSRRLKQTFPQLEVLLLADGIYPNGPVFALCKEFGWKYLFVLQNKVLTSVWEDFEGLMNMPLNALGVKDKDPIKIQGDNLYRWQNDISYQGEQFDGQVNVMDVQIPNSKGEYVRCRGFITNLKLSEVDIEDLENLGQQRWKIENQGFDSQKHHGYALEHIWCKNSNAMKVVYLLIQIAHLFNQLFIHADFLALNLASQTTKAFFKLYLAAFTQTWSEELALQSQMLKGQHFQIRWQI